ncbi:unnamed protein product [Malus baccata var. baccata]
MTQSSHSIREHILDFDDDFERELRRKRKNPELSESSLNLEAEVESEEEQPTVRVGEMEEAMAQDNRTIKELSASGLDNAAPLCIQYPAAAQGKTKEFELKSSLLHHIPKYHGLSMEDPNKHLKEFEVVCSNMTPINVDGSILKIKAFPFSLMEKAKDWLYELAPGTVTSWESMKRAFLEKFFPTSRVILLRKRISGIQQDEGVGQRSTPRQQQVYEVVEEDKMQGPKVCGVCSMQGHPSEQYPQLIENGGKKAPIPINSNVIPPNVPFPSRFLQTKNEEEEKDVLETFRKVHVNIPLIDAIKQIPKYAKCLKKLCTTRKRIREKEVVHVSENVSTMLQRKLPPKCKDPGSFRIPYVIGNTRFEHAMLDLGRPLDFSCRFLCARMEDTYHSSPSPLLLGRPFMKTAQTKIDVAKGAVTMAFSGHMINFKISKSVEKTNDVRSCCAIDVIENIGHECSTIIKRDVSRTTIKEGLGLKYEEHVLTSKTPNLAESIPCASVQCATTSLQHMGEPSSPLSIPTWNNRLLPCLVQVVKEAPLHAVGSNEASKEYRPAARH